MKDVRNDYNIEFLPVKIDTRSLGLNRRKHTEFSTEIPSQDLEKVKKIKEVLMQLPLIHFGHRDIPNSKPLLSSRKSGVKAATGELDRSLGLDKYVYFHWGPIPYLNDKRHCYVAETQVLLQPQTVVTAEDITTYTFGGITTEFSKLPEEQRQRIISNYFGEMLTGADWLELQARKILNTYNQGKYEIEISGPLFLGEVKALEKADPNHIVKVDDRDSRAKISLEWWKKGFRWKYSSPEDIRHMGLAENNDNKYWKSLLG